MVAAVVLAVVLVVLPSPGGGIMVTLASEHTAAATAARFTSGISGGPWQLTYALGFLGGGPANTSRLVPRIPSCPIRNASPPGIIPALAPSASVYRGMAQAWLLEFANPGGTTNLAVLVENGGASELGQWSGSGCEPPAPLAPPLIDSTTAAQALATNASGSAFIAAHPQANATFILEYTSYPAGKEWKNATIWIVDFQAPPAIPVEAEVFASNGTIECVGAGPPYCPD